MGRTNREDSVAAEAISSVTPLPTVVEVAVLSGTGDAEVIKRVTAVISPSTITLRPIADIQADVRGVLGDDGNEFNDALNYALLETNGEEDARRELYNLLDLLIDRPFFTRGARLLDRNNA